MKAYVATNIVGVFAFDKDGKTILSKTFPKNPEKIAERLRKSREGEIIEEEREVLTKLRLKGYKEVIWDKEAKDGEISCVYDPDNKGKEIANNEFRRLALENRWAATQSELNEILTKVNVLLSGQKIKSSVKKDKIIMHVIGVVDELDTDLNSLSERLREWYGLHFPEMLKQTKTHDKFAEIIVKYGAKENIEDSELAGLVSKSVGMDFTEEDAKSVKEYSKVLLDMRQTRNSLSKYLEDICEETVPNLSAVADPLLAARLLSLAGGLEKIAKLPSSTVQLLGAEKALFRHLKGQGKAPKYGVLFGHVLVQQAPKHLKGKIARLISSKLSLASKIDFFSERNEGKDMRKELEKKVKNMTK
ncbi:MAG: hypothetical protein KAS04_05320 [Candidatus Aenigmarchaeota archaeon]|nr:hypothetical protein [Candidatus Aenigmarchaeota archaeon]